jgi:type II secretory pathway component PulK
VRILYEDPQNHKLNRGKQERKCAYSPAAAELSGVSGAIALDVLALALRRAVLPFAIVLAAIRTSLNLKKKKQIKTSSLIAIASAG